MVYVPHTEEEYQRLVVFLDALMDEVGEDETHPLASLMEVVGCSLSAMKRNMCLS
jgi:HTH-type transcriptional regulator/antitoxin HigA